jgi:mannosyltransferase
MTTDAATARAPAGASAALQRIREHTLALDVAIVSGVSLILGLIRLGGPSLWYDEAYTYRQIHKGYLAQFEGYQPFYYWVHKPWTSLAGTSEWAMRFPSVLGAMLACALLVVLARELFDRRVALVSGLLLATSPYFVKWSQQARAYTLIAAAAILATLLLLRAIERHSRGAWAAYGLAFTGLLVTHAVAGLLLVPAHAVLIAQRRHRVLPHGLLAGVIVVALGVPWVAQLAMRTDSSTSETAWIPFPSAEYATRALLDLSGIAGLGILLAVVGAWMLWKAGDGQRALWLATWAFAPFVVAIVISLARPVFVDRYLIVAAPAFALLAALAIVGVAARLRVGVVAAVAVATAAGLVLWYSSSDDGNWRGEDWRSAVAFVNERTGDAGAIVVVPWWTHDAAEYYGAPASDTSTANAIWILHWSENGHEIPADVRKPLGFEDHTLVESRQFGWRVSAQLWKRRD